MMDYGREFNFGFRFREILFSGRFRRSSGALQFLGADHDDGDVGGDASLEVVVDALDGDLVDGGGDFLKGAGAAEEEIILGEAAGAAAGGFGFDDGAGLEADAGAFDLGGGYAEAEAVKFGEEAVERGLGLVVARAGIAEDSAEALEAAVAGPDVVDEAAFFAELGEEASGRAAAEDLDGDAHRVIVGVGLKDGVVGEADVGLLAVLFLEVSAAGLAGGDGGFGADAV